MALIYFLEGNRRTFIIEDDRLKYCGPYRCKEERFCSFVHTCLFVVYVKLSSEPGRAKGLGLIRVHSAASIFGTRPGAGMFASCLSLESRVLESSCPNKPLR